MSWRTAQGRLGEYARFLLCSFQLLGLVQELERWLEKRRSARFNMDTPGGPRQECQAKIDTNVIQIHQVPRLILNPIYTKLYPNTIYYTEIRWT